MATKLKSSQRASVICYESRLLRETSEAFRRPASVCGHPRRRGQESRRGRGTQGREAAVAPLDKCPLLLSSPSEQAIEQTEDGVRENNNMKSTEPVTCLSGLEWFPFPLVGLVGRGRVDWWGTAHLSSLTLSGNNQALRFNADEATLAKVFTGNSDIVILLRPAGGTAYRMVDLELLISPNGQTQGRAKGGHVAKTSSSLPLAA